MLDGTVEGFESWESAVPPSTMPIADETEGADMLYSSSTTGRPKGIKVPQRRILGNAGGLLGLTQASSNGWRPLSPAPRITRPPALQHASCATVAPR